MGCLALVNVGGWLVRGGGRVGGWLVWEDRAAGKQQQGQGGGATSPPAASCQLCNRRQPFSAVLSNCRLRAAAQPSPAQPSPAQPSQPTAHLVGQRQPELNLPSQLAGAPLLLQCRLQQAGRDGVLPPLVSQLAACKLDGPQLLLSPQLLRTLRGVQCGATRRGSEGKDAGQQLK